MKNKLNRYYRKGTKYYHMKIIPYTGPSCACTNCAFEDNSNCPRLNSDYWDLPGRQHGETDYLCGRDPEDPGSHVRTYKEIDPLYVDLCKAKEISDGDRMATKDNKRGASVPQAEE